MTKKAPKKASKSGRPKKPAGVPRAKHHQFLIPGDDQIERWRQKLEDCRKLSLFDPADTQQLLAQARALSGGETTVDDAVVRLQAKRLEAQATTLVRALGLDLDKPNVWEEAFGRLALIHYGVGRLVHRKFSYRTDRIYDSCLLASVRVMQQHGYLDREAVRELAAKGIFPYRERRAHSGSKRGDERWEREEARKRRFNALWRQYLRAKKRQDPGAALPGFESAFGLSDGAFGAQLKVLEAPPPLPHEETPLPQPHPGGDKSA